MTAMTASPAPDTRTSRSWAAWYLIDTTTLTTRALRHNIRHVDALIMGAALPVMLLLLFVYVFGGAIEIGGDYLDYVVPGIVVLAAGFGASQVAVSVNQDLTTGTIDRLRSLPMSPAALLTGHILASVVRNLASTLLVVGVALIMGFRPGASVLGLVGALGVAALFILTMATVSAAIGVAAGSVDAAAGFTFFMLFLPYVSSAFVPPETLPTALRGFAEHQFVTPVIDTMRGLLLGKPVGSSSWLAVAWCLGIIALTMPMGIAAFRYRTRR